MITVIGIVVCILLALIVFFMFCIWRAILGKSSVDLRLGISIDRNTKKTEELTKNILVGNNSIDQLKKEYKEFGRMLAKFLSDKEKESENK